MATATERQFAKGVQRIHNNWITSNRAALARVDDLIGRFQDDVVVAIAGGPQTDWQSHHLRQVQRGLQDSRRRLQVRLADEWGSGSSDAIKWAIKGVDDPLSFIGVPATMPFSVSDREAYLVSEYVPSLIKDISDEALRKVQTQLQAAVLGTGGGAEMKATVAKAVGSYKRAGVVFRTEMNRLHNLTRTHRIDDLSQSHPALGKKWLHRPSKQPRPAHVALHGTVIYPSDGEKFSVNGYKVDGPHDPNLPAKESINCHCTVVATYNESRIGKQYGPEDKVLASKKYS